MIIAIVRVNISPKNQKAATEILKYITGSVQIASGFIGYKVCRDMEDPNIITLTEEWEAQSELENYIASNEYRKMLALMDIRKSTGNQFS